MFLNRLRADVCGRCSRVDVFLTRQPFTSSLLHLNVLGLSRKFCDKRIMEKKDSDSGNSPPREDEKVADGDLDTKRQDQLDSLPDPDAGLSDEERAKIVSITTREAWCLAIAKTLRRIRSSSGSLTS